MHDTLDVHTHIRLLECADLLSAQVTEGEELERIPRDLLKDRVVVAARKRHRGGRIVKKQDLPAATVR